MSRSSTAPALSHPPSAADDSASIYVCPLDDVPTLLTSTGARFLLTVINEQLMPSTPSGLDPANHLRLACNDITAAMPGLIAPAETHATEIIDFARRWNRQGPLVVHCWAGVSRSSAAAFVTLCALNPGVQERTIARSLRQASPTAHPNRLMVELGDRALDRGGRMVAAIDSIGHGAPLMTNARPYRLASWYKS